MSVIQPQRRRYSFGGNIEQPRRVLPGGYISFAFVDNSTRSLAQRGREPNHALDAWCTAHRQVVEAAASARAKAYTF